MQLDKRDLLTIAVLVVIFFSVATWNLGMTQTPVTTAQFSAGQSFYVDIGAATTVKSVVLLLKDGSFSITVSTGSPSNWQTLPNTATFSDYYKWYEIGIQQDTQYLKFNFTSSSSAVIAEMAVINPYSQRIAVASINGSDDGNQNLSNLTDEQDLVQYPATYMSQTYFDEIYFVRTAEQYLNRQWPYEWTHPPLGKLIQASGIAVFGFSPFGWRIMGVLFATLMIPVMYMLGKKLFGTWIGAFASAFLLTFDFMHFTMARMGTADTYVVFFSLLSQLFFVFYFFNVVKGGWKTSVLPLLLAVVSFALSFSTKWLVLYSAIGMMFMLVLLLSLRLFDAKKLKKKLATEFAAFFDRPFLLLLGSIGVVAGIYFLIYIPDMLAGRPFIGTRGDGVVDLQFAMFNYHSTLVATHDFASAWWSWPFMVSTRGYVPLWLAISNLPNNVHSTIAVMGNPAVWWVGFASMIAVTERAMRGKELWKMLILNLKEITVKSLKLVSHFWKKLVGRLWSCEKKIPIFSNIFELIMKRDILKQQTTETASGEYDLTAIFIAVVFFFSWIPYVLISRLTFIYHFYVSVPFLCLASAYFINKYWNTKWGKIAAVAFFVSVVVLFGLFYPVISGVPEPTSLIDRLKWFPSWYF
jgi:dolichyl-phosphate-mannose--protein O-mannosyl transferase